MAGSPYDLLLRGNAHDENRICVHPGTSKGPILIGRGAGMRGAGPVPCLWVLPSVGGYHPGHPSQLPPNQ